MIDMVKKLKEEKNTIIQFSDDEVESLGLRKNWKYSVDAQNNKIVLTPYSEMEIDLNDFDKKILIYLIQISAERDISINDVFNDVLMEAVEFWENHG